MNKMKRTVFASLVLTLVACSADDQQEPAFTPKEMKIGHVEYGEWIRPATRAEIGSGVTVYVSAGGAAPTAYEKTEGAWQVVSGTAQEWTAASMEVYGFVRDDGVASVTTPYQIPLTQNTSTACSFLASSRASQNYDSNTGGSISIAMTQRLAKLEVTVSDAVGTTQLAVGNGGLLCRGMFNYDGGSDGSWNTTIANGATITVTECDANKVFTVYVLPQTPATGSRFFAVSNSANHVAYYALPAGTQFQAGKVYSCTLIQDMTVASISIDPDFNNGTETVETTTGSN